MEIVNYYQILGVSVNATQEEIKNAYRKCVKMYHPDINHDPEAEDIMKEINEAYDVLSDLGKRKIYDTSINANTNQNTAYDSYAHSREENEYDLEEFIKKYLKYIRMSGNDNLGEALDVLLFGLSFLDSDFKNDDSIHYYKKKTL